MKNTSKLTILDTFLRFGSLLRSTLTTFRQFGHISSIWPHFVNLATFRVLVVLDRSVFWAGHCFRKKPGEPLQTRRPAAGRRRTLAPAPWYGSGWCRWYGSGHWRGHPGLSACTTAGPLYHCWPTVPLLAPLAGHHCTTSRTPKTRIFTVLDTKKPGFSLFWTLSDRTVSDRIRTYGVLTWFSARNSRKIMNFRHFGHFLRCQVSR